MEPISIIATFIATIGGALAVSEQILKWYKEYQNNVETKIQKTTITVIISNKDGKRIVYNVNSKEEVDLVVSNIAQDLSENLSEQDK